MDIFKCLLNECLNNRKAVEKVGKFCVFGGLVGGFYIYNLTQECKKLKKNVTFLENRVVELEKFADSCRDDLT